MDFRVIDDLQSGRSSLDTKKPTRRVGYSAVTELDYLSIASLPFSRMCLSMLLTPRALEATTLPDFM